MIFELVDGLVDEMAACSHWRCVCGPNFAGLIKHGGGLRRTHASGTGHKDSIGNCKQPPAGNLNFDQLCVVACIEALSSMA